MERAASLQGLILHISQIRYKNSPNTKKFIPSLKGPRKASLHVPQKQGLCGNGRPFLEPYLAYFSGSPVKEPASRFPSQSSLRERCLIPRAFRHPSLKVPGKRAPFQVPQRGPYGKRCPFPEPFLPILQGTQQGSPPSRFPSQSSRREKHPTSRAPFSHLSKSPVDEPTPGCLTEPP
jgi:hypothetical protein